MEKKYIAIALFGEYNCKDFLNEHEGQEHTSDEWLRLIKKFKGEDGLGVFPKKHEFRTETELLAFREGIEEADDYFSSNFYTVTVLYEGITDSAYEKK